jgi:gas vesicle protein
MWFQDILPDREFHMADRDSNGMLWFAAGAVIGASMALLYAPKSGKDTRKYIGQRTDAGREALAESGKDLVEQGKELYERGRKLADEAADLFERGRKLVQG